MIYELAVPGPIEEVQEVRVLEWHGPEGHAFAPGELVVELETHKALVEVRAGQAGVLRRIVCAEGAWQTWARRWRSSATRQASVCPLPVRASARWRSRSRSADRGRPEARNAARAQHAEDPPTAGAGPSARGTGVSRRSRSIGT